MVQAAQSWHRCDPGTCISTLPGLTASRLSRFGSAPIREAHTTLRSTLPRIQYTIPRMLTPAQIAELRAAVILVREYSAFQNLRI